MTKFHIKIMVLFMLLLIDICANRVFAAKVDSVHIMPWPQYIETSNTTYAISDTLNIYLSGVSDERVNFQITRFNEQLGRISSFKGLKVSRTSKKEQSQIQVLVQEPSEAYKVPSFNEDESYQLEISPKGIMIKADSVFGAQHGLTTLMQLISTSKNNKLPSLIINDSPRFAWRGLLIDSVRHFISLETIKRQLDGMAAAKLNVLHWHLTDDQGWRIESKRYPKLTSKASDKLFYTQTQIKEVIEYASLLGIRVVPEFGMPGHASAIAVAYPELMAAEKEYKMERHWGVFKPLLDVSNPKAYEFVDQLIAEMAAIFPDQFLHIGGDEVEPEHWLESKKIQSLMTQQGLKNGHDIQNYFNQRIQPILQKHNKVMMGWDEIFHPKLPDNIVVQSWRGHDSLNAIAKAGYQGILSTGFYIDQPQYTDYHYRNDLIPTNNDVDTSLPIISAHKFTIDRLKGSDVQGELLLMGNNSKTTQALIKLNKNHHALAQEVQPFKNSDDRRWFLTMDSWMGPLNFEFDFLGSQSAVMIGNSRYPVILETAEFKPTPITLSDTITSEQSKGILGGEATIWSEMVTDQNIDVRIWPRLFAISERLWSAKHTTDTDSMFERLDTMDVYAAKVIGLSHKKQQTEGLKAIASSAKKGEQEIAFDYLMSIAQILEPAHYYTRHHIKYLNDEYHQMASLSLFVDYLEVESKQARYLKGLINEYIQGESANLEALKRFVLELQTTLNSYDLVPSSELGSLLSTIEHLKSFNAKTLGVIDACNLGVQHTNKIQQDIEAALLNTQSLENELVNPLVVPIRDLYVHCQGK